MSTRNKTFILGLTMLSTNHGLTVWRRKEVMCVTGIFSSCDKITEFQGTI